MTWIRSIGQPAAVGLVKAVVWVEAVEEHDDLLIAERLAAEPHEVDGPEACVGDEDDEAGAERVDEGDVVAVVSDR